MLPFLPEQIEQWPIARLKPYARNARTHSDDQIAKIAASLVEYGWTAPGMVADDDEIVAGHGRLLAARQLGLEQVPVIRLAHLTPEQVRAYRIADNRLSELSGWDVALLAAELQALDADGFDLGLTGSDFEWSIDDCCAANLSAVVADDPGQQRAFRFLGNRVFQCQGVKLLGGKHVLIAGNSFRLPFNYAVFLGGDDSYGEGARAIEDVLVYGNTVTDLVTADQVGNVNVVLTKRGADEWIVSGDLA
ncbi:MAG: ParB N-terminal domain-containing protein [Rhodospirillales bacterium]|nr:ParB N-terminal domain-containing protein [Rhodospirillales bacterium]